MNPSTGSTEKTIAIIAFANGGTTMLAGILECFGVPMVGPHTMGMNWEDAEIIDTMRLRGHKPFKELVERRNKQHAIWGFKHPGAHRWHVKYKFLRNPIYLAIWKDPLSITKRRWQSATDSFLLEMQYVCVNMSQVVWNIHKAGIDVKMFSYHQALAHPEKFVKNVAKATGLAVTNYQVNQAIQFIQPNTTDNWSRPYPQVKRK